jgi:hypothetical protein
MKPDIRGWQMRLFIILLIGGGIGYFLQTFLLGGLFGFSSGSSAASSLFSRISFALLGFLFEALPVALLARPKSSDTVALQSRWASGYVLAWLAMTLIVLVISTGLHMLLSKSGGAIALSSSRWSYLGISLMATVAGSYALFFVLNLRFAISDWGSDWQYPVWILAGGQVALSVLMSFVYAAGGQMPMMIILITGIVGQIVQAIVLAWALGEWRGGIETQGPSGGGMVF